MCRQYRYAQNVEVVLLGFGPARQTVREHRVWASGQGGSALVVRSYLFAKCCGLIWVLYGIPV